MAYRVERTAQVETELDRIFALVIREEPYRGPIWCGRFKRAILWLCYLLERNPVEVKLSRTGRFIYRMPFGHRPHV